MNLEKENELLKQELISTQMMVAAIVAQAGGTVRLDSSTLDAIRPNTFIYSREDIAKRVVEISTGKLPLEPGFICAPFRSPMRAHVFQSPIREIRTAGDLWKSSNSIQAQRLIAMLSIELDLNRQEVINMPINEFLQKLQVSSPPTDQHQPPAQSHS